MTNEIYYIDQARATGNALSLDAVIGELANYEPDAYVHVFAQGPHGTRLIYVGLASSVLSLESFAL